MGTVGEFDQFITRWTQRGYGQYLVLYLGFHGTRDSIEVGGCPLPLDDLAAQLGEADPGGVIHFGSCQTPLVSSDRIDAFAKTAGLHSVSGYTKAVDWADSAVLDAALLNAIADHQTRCGMRTSRSIGTTPAW